MKKLFCVVLVALIGGVLFAQVSDEQIRQSANTLGVPFAALKQLVESYRPQAAASDIITISAVQLNEEYDNNVLKADSQYKGKSLQVTGTILSIGQDSNGNYYVSLDGDDLFEYIRVFFQGSELNKLAALSEGQQVTIVGICNGKQLTEIGFGHSAVEIRNSTIQN